MIKVLIVDDQELIRESLKVVLNVSAGIEVVDAVPSVAEAMKSAASRLSSTPPAPPAEWRRWSGRQACTARLSAMEEA